MLVEWVDTVGRALQAEEQHSRGTATRELVVCLGNCGCRGVGGVWGCRGDGGPEDAGETSFCFRKSGAQSTGICFKSAPRCFPGGLFLAYPWEITGYIQTTGPGALVQG